MCWSEHIFSQKFWPSTRFHFSVVNFASQTSIFSKIQTFVNFVFLNTNFSKILAFGLGQGISISVRGKSGDSQGKWDDRTCRNHVVESCVNRAFGFELEQLISQSQLHKLPYTLKCLNKSIR